MPDDLWPTRAPYPLSTTEERDSEREDSMLRLLRQFLDRLNNPGLAASALGALALGAACVELGTHSVVDENGSSVPVYSSSAGTATAILEVPKTMSGDYIRSYQEERDRRAAIARAVKLWSGKT